jgi:hypothetical protein
LQSYNERNKWFRVVNAGIFRIKTNELLTFIVPMYKKRARQEKMNENKKLEKINLKSYR